MKTTTINLLRGSLCALALAGCGSDAPADQAAPSSTATTPTSSDTVKSAPPTTAQAGAPASPASADPANTAAAAATTPTASVPSTPANAGTAVTVTPPTAAAIDWQGDIRGQCENFKTNFPDDHACIPAPPAGEGMQFHIGPKNYDDADEVAQYIMHPGEESDECFSVLTPNDKAIHYQTSTVSGRAGTHHIINTMYEGGEDAEVGPHKCSDGDDATKQLGSVPGASKPYMPRLPVAPEYAHVGRSIVAKAKIQADMHYYNFTDHDILREFWVNIYFAKDEDITEESKQIAALGGFGWNKNPIQPKTDKTFSYSCPAIKGDGYILQLLGHYHAHGRHFTASITRKAGGTDKVFEMYDYMEPAQFEYNSIANNPTFSASAAGAVTGRLALHDGDILNWDCHIVNDSDVALKYVNEVKTGEMCNLWGQSLGVDAINCYLQ